MRPQLLIAHLDPSIIFAEDVPQYVVRRRAAHGNKDDPDDFYLIDKIARQALLHYVHHTAVCPDTAFVSLYMIPMTISEGLTSWWAGYNPPDDPPARPALAPPCQS